MGDTGKIHGDTGGVTQVRLYARGGLTRDDDTHTTYDNTLYLFPLILVLIIYPPPPPPNRFSYNKINTPRSLKRSCR